MQRKRPAPLILIGEKDAILGGRTVKYLLKQSARIRGYRLEIRQGTGLIVVVPRKYSQNYIDELLSNKSRWILRHLPADSPYQMPLFRKEADHGDKIPFMGRWLQIVQVAGKGRAEAATIDGKRLLISADGQGMAAALEKWYRMQASAIFRDKADVFKGPMGVAYHRIFIRGQRARWASCSHQHNLTFNWKLLFAPEHIVDYVIIHELAHLKHMNHSRKFWDMVVGYCPKFKEYRKWLLAHEEELKSYATFAV
jgi:predicted metal-dependent hydrolase